MAYNPNNPNGQATMANSEPVVIASDQSAIPVTQTSQPLPTGASTAANQATEISSLASIISLLTNLNSKDFSTQTTLAAILAKIIAAPATEAKQDTGNSSLATIAGKDFATQTTLAAILAKIIAAPSTEAKQDTSNTHLSNLNAKDFATQTTLALVKAKTDNLDLAITALRDALRGGSNKTLTDLDSQLIDVETALNSLINFYQTIGATSSGVKGLPTFGIVSTSNPSYSNGTVNGLSLTPDGSLRVNGSFVPGTSYEKDSKGSTTALTTTGLNSLGSSATAGWISDRIVVSDALDYLIHATFRTANTAPANDKACYLYIVPWYYNGTDYIPSMGGKITQPPATQGAFTIAEPHNFLMLGCLSYTTQVMNLQGTFLLSNAFGANMPDAFSIYIKNYSGAALASSGHALEIKKINRKNE